MYTIGLLPQFMDHVITFIEVGVCDDLDRLF